MSGAWYVGRTSWRRGWLRLAFLGIVAGVVGGVVLGALAGARRTSSAYDRLLRASGAPHEVLFVTADAPEIQEWLRQERSVERFAPAAGMIGRRAPQQDWYSLDAPVGEGSFGPPVLERGRLPRPDRADEVYLTVRTARNTGLDLGDEVVFNAYARDQTQRIIKDPWTVPRGARVAVRVVGVARDPSDAQLSQSSKLMFGTPAFARMHRADTTFTLLAVWLTDGPNGAARFERGLAQFARTLPDETLPFSTVSSVDNANAANQSARAVLTGLAIFALVAGLAGLITVTQTTRRYLSQADGERRVLVALGASRFDRTAAQFVEALPYLAIAPIVAVAVAYATSPAFPIGATRALEPHTGFRVDALVLTAGGAVWLALLSLLTLIVAWTGSGIRRPRTRARKTTGADAAAGGATLPAWIGMRFALRPDTRRRALQRTAIAGVVVAVIGVVGSAVFVASLDELTRSPARYGLDFDASLELPTGQSQRVFDRLVARDDLAAVAAMRSGIIDLDGRSVNAYSVERRKGDMRAVVRTGRLPRDVSEIAVGPKLLSEQHKQIGDEVRVTTDGDARNLVVVGTVLSPEPESPDFNAEAALTTEALDEFGSNPFVEAIARIRAGADHDRVLAELDTEFPYAVSDESTPSAPGPIRNLEQISRLPFVLVLFFAILGAAAIGQALFMTSAERRRDIAVLRSLGLTRRQVGVLIASAATSFSVVAIVFGIPLGLLAGKFGWSAVANSLFVAPTTVVPAVAVAVSAVGLIAFAGVIARVPTRLTLRQPPAKSLRTE